MDSITDIIQDLKADDPLTGVLEVVECLEQARDTISDLQAKVEQHDKDKISIGRNVQKMVREFDAERKELQAKVEKYGKRYHQERHENIELRAKVEVLTVALKEIADYSSDEGNIARAALKQEGE